ncbi:type 2 isopentenyl-diphosphate Delta-isomerase [Paenibacillus tarimensis]|uniref:type 2 isopentenyl-diphosphate Delta-isomerase n=1 Tax=Paenibacillus tarimensis TaxID=416012 RepID=UPI001F28ED28|nr:type 2 isopentenyl-diphosphate Delta-isomerase [Paenibacillus tarimensis]MCF2943909.1 type 2 isopentenyl-diphosphate Delta-isomerase [Paenibacillus tarimensis]
MKREHETIQNAGRLTARRKSEHIRICLEEQVESGLTAGFESYRFRHAAVPELNFSDIGTGAYFLGKKVAAPLLISSMTGGTDEAGAINLLLAEAAEERGWAIGLGSMRAAIEDGELAPTFKIRQAAPTIPVLANVGAVQLNYGFGVEQCREIVELAEADGLVLHLNSMQEIFQPEGDTNFRNLLARIETLCAKLEVPVGVKEVGWGIDGANAVRLAEAGAAFIDVAGAGGTSWSQVEKHRSTDKVRREAAEAFTDWGIPTAECIHEVRSCLKDVTLIASGGLRSGVDAAKALALGADLAGFGRSLLAGAAVGGREERLAAIYHQLERIEFELKAAMFGIGAASLEELHGTDRLVRLS